MTQVRLRSVRAGALTVGGLELDAGLFPVLARAEVGALLVAALAGQLRGRTGTLEVGGADPQRSPAARARVGAVLAEEPALDGATVGAVVRDWLGDPNSSALQDLGLGAWRERDPRRLEPAERRSVALAVALATPAPLLVAIFEPLADAPGVDRAALLRRLRELADAGATVVPVTASVRDALALGGQLHSLVHGVAARVSEPRASSDPVWGAEFVVESDAARALAARLLDHPSVRAVRFDETAAPRTVRVRAADAHAGSRAILDAALDGGITVAALRLEPPTLPVIEAAASQALRATLARPLAPPARPDPWTVAMPFGVPPPPPPPPPGAPVAAPGTAPPLTASAPSDGTAAALPPTTPPTPER